MAERGITGLGVLISPQYDPYLNIAAEERLFQTVPENEQWLYLWQNEKTVVIGRNQDAFSECALSALYADGGRLARRLSGGGAVYHDLGNLNFTFVNRGENDNARHMEVIAKALAHYGIQCQLSGRNDLTADSRKFSGSAYYSSGDRHLHHGTLMVCVDRDCVERYLTPHPQKLSKKGVSSVRSRVVDLTEINPAVTVEGLRTELIRAFEEEYGHRAVPLPDGLWTDREVLTRRDFFASDGWALRPLETPDCQSEVMLLSNSLCRLCLWRRDGRISRAVLLTDSLDVGSAETVARALKGLPFTRKAVADGLAQAGLSEFAPLAAAVGEDA